MEIGARTCVYTLRLVCVHCVNRRTFFGTGKAIKSAPGSSSFHVLGDDEHGDEDPVVVGWGLTAVESERD